MKTFSVEFELDDWIEIQLALASRSMMTVHGPYGGDDTQSKQISAIRKGITSQIERQIELLATSAQKEK